MTKTYRNLVDRDAGQESEFSGSAVTEITGEELLEILSERNKNERLELKKRKISNVDLSLSDLDNIDFSCTRFENVNLDGASMDHCNVSRCFFVDCSMRGIRLTNYEVGQYVYPLNGFSDYGWLDDSPGLHFFMDRDMAIAFGTGNY